MIRRISSFAPVAALAIATLLAAPATAQRSLARQTSKISADPNQEYLLGKEHGPWTIMVATFHATGDGETDEGKTPEQAAHDLVIELRQKGIPAYVYTSEGKSERIRTTDRQGREEIRKPLRRVTTVCVFAGNYPSLSDEKAQATLKWVKKYTPKAFEEGVVVRTKKDRGPLASAFLATNPLLSAQDIQSQSLDPLAINLNTGMRNSLFENKGKYTLVIASFSGKNVAVKPGDPIPSVDDFLKRTQENETNLDDAGESAHHLAEHLRGEVTIRCAPNEEIRHKSIDAFVWHDEFRSIVTVGQFDSPTDPMIKKYKSTFGAKDIVDGRNGTRQEMRFLAVDGYGKGRDQYRMWVFDPNPQLMVVPKKR